MKVKTYNLQHGWFSLTLPDDWDEYDDGNEGTFAFFNSKTFSGNLRITPFHWENRAAAIVEEKVTENKGAIKIKLGKFDCAHFKNDVTQDGEELVVYYWFAGENSDIYFCSFTIDKIMEHTPQNKIALEVVQEIIKSIV